MTIRRCDGRSALLLLIFSFSFLFIFSCNTNTSTAIAEDLPKFDRNGEMPVFSITTNKAIVDEPKVKAQLILKQEDRSLYNGKIAIEIRGASSQLFEKKSYGFETRDAFNEETNVPLLGFPEEKDWILNGPYSDKSLIRNVLIYHLAREMGRYASRTELVEVEINGVYKGVYVFMENMKRDVARINVSKLDADELSGKDLTGGYILKIDRVSVADRSSSLRPQKFFTSQIPPPMASMGQTIKFRFEYPDAAELAPAQKKYISNYVNAFETALASDNFMDPKLGYANYIDVDSFVDFFLLNELSNNVDAYRLSTFMYKDKNGKLNMGPIWDFNFAFGNADYCGGANTDVWAYKFNERCPDDFCLVPFWWDRLLQDPTFTATLKQRWSKLRGAVLGNASINATIDGYVSRMGKTGAIQKNFDTWKILGIYVWPNKFVGNSYEAEEDYLKTWINDRLTWLDGAIDTL